MTEPATLTAPASGGAPSVADVLRSPALRRVGIPAAGVGALLGLWWLGGLAIASNPNTAAFSDFAPGPTFASLWDMLLDGSILEALIPSLMRVGLGLGWAVVLGLPLGILIGRVPAFREATHIPFQFLRMVSPLSWMPIAVMTFHSWDAAIVFLIAAAAVWPVTFATANGLRKVDPAWFKVARNLGARGWHMLMHIIMPAIAQDVLTGIRLALGVAWIVLVPAEYLGVTSGLGYAINDARDILEYDRLAALVVTIGVLGFALDGICLTLIRRYSWVRSA